MSLLKGIQSAVFYYLSCAPCTKITSRRKRKAEAARARQEKAAFEKQKPGLYAHPSPFSTNIYWHEEISMGPGPPLRKAGRDRGSRTGSRRELTTGGQGSSMGSSADTTIVADGGSPDMDDLGFSREGWNTRRYQRVDEELWGYDANEYSEIGETDGYRRGSSVGLSGLSRGGTTSHARYYVARNPAVNDLHPPVVSTQPTHKCETRWMLQPPPSAKIMEGKLDASRSRSGSGNSSRRGGEAISLSRRVGERLMEEKVRRGERPPTTEASDRSRAEYREWLDSSRESSGQPHDRDTRRSVDSISSRRKNRPPPSLDPVGLTPPAPALILPFQSPVYTADSQSPPHGINMQTISCSSIQRTSNISALPTLDPPLASTSRSDITEPICTVSNSTDFQHVLQKPSVPTSILNSLTPQFNSPSHEPPFKPRTSTLREEGSFQLPECETWFPLGDFRFPAPTSAEPRSQQGNVSIRPGRTMSI